MEHSGFFNAVRDSQGNYDRMYKAEDLAQFFSSFISNGIFPSPSTNLQVMSNGDMTVTIKAGKAGINGYQYYNDADLILPIDIADGVLNRIDRIVLRMDIANRAINAVVKKGTFASSPTATPLQRDADAYELALSDIYVGAGVTSIAQANITDLRQNSDVCGWISSILRVDSATLFNQWTAAFNSWFATARNTLDSDSAGKLLDMFTDTKEYSTYKSNIDDNGIAIEVELKRVDGTTIMKSILSGGTSPQYAYRTEVWYKDANTIELIIYDLTYDANNNLTSEVIHTQKTLTRSITVDFANKVAGSVVENPNIGKATSKVTLLAPDSSIPEFTQKGYIDATKIDGEYANFSINVKDQIPQILFAWDLISDVESKFGITIPGANTSDKVMWLKNILGNVIFNCWSFGKYLSNNICYIGIYDNTANVWRHSNSDSANGNLVNKQSTIQQMFCNISQTSGDWLMKINNIIDSNGFINYIVYTDATDGTTPSMINVDYVNLQIKF